MTYIDMISIAERMTKDAQLAEEYRELLRALRSHQVTIDHGFRTVGNEYEKKTYHVVEIVNAKGDTEWIKEVLVIGRDED